MHPPKYSTEEYKLGSKLVSSWAKKVRAGKKLYSGKGAPSRVTPEVKREVEDFTESSVYLKQPHEATELLQKLVGKSLED